MAWENFWKLDDQGRRVTSGEQLIAFRKHFPERIVEAKPAIRPLMLVLDKPYKLIKLRPHDIYEHQPAVFRDINGWPPSLSLSRFGHFPRPGEGEVVDAKVVQPERPGGDPVLVIRGEFEQQQAACAIVGYPTVFLECVARTVNAHTGHEFRSLNSLELSGIE